MFSRYELIPLPFKDVFIKPRAIVLITHSMKKIRVMNTSHMRITCLAGDIGFDKGLSTIRIRIDKTTQILMVPSKILYKDREHF